MISYVFWQRRYAGDPAVMGKILRLNRRPFEIVGVTPPWFTGLNVDRGFDVAIPIACEPLLHPDRSALDSHSNWWLNVLGRLRPEESFAQAAARMNLLAPDVNRATLPPDWNPQDQAQYLKNLFALSPAARGFSETGAQYRGALFLLMAIAALVLLTGGGFLLALAGSRFLIHLLSTTANPLDIDLSPDLRVFAFTLAAAVLTALLFGLAPAFLATRVELERALKENARTATSGASRFDSTKALIVGQVALSLMLLVGSGLFLGTLRNLLTIDPGFQRQNVLVIDADFQQASVPKSQRVRVYGETGAAGRPGRFRHRASARPLRRGLRIEFGDCPDQRKGLERRSPSRGLQRHVFHGWAVVFQPDFAGIFQDDADTAARWPRVRCA